LFKPFSGPVPQRRTHPEEHPDFKALNDAIRLQGNIGTVGKKITATFTGEFTSHSKRPNRVLTLERVENLKVQIEKPQSKMGPPVSSDTVDPWTGNPGVVSSQLYLQNNLGQHLDVSSLSRNLTASGGLLFAFSLFYAFTEIRRWPRLYDRVRLGEMN
jgi:hypothetical protein